MFNLEQLSPQELLKILDKHAADMRAKGFYVVKDEPKKHEKTKRQVTNK